MVEQLTQEQIDDYSAVAPNGDEEYCDCGSMLRTDEEKQIKVCRYCK